MAQNWRIDLSSAPNTLDLRGLQPIVAQIWRSAENWRATQHTYPIAGAGNMVVGHRLADHFVYVNKMINKKGIGPFYFAVTNILGNRAELWDFLGTGLPRHKIYAAPRGLVVPSVAAYGAITATFLLCW